MFVIFENISFGSFIKFLFIKNKFMNDKYKLHIRYIDPLSYIFKQIVRILSFFYWPIKCLKFNFNDLKNDNGMLIGWNILIRSHKWFHICVRLRSIIKYRNM